MRLIDADALYKELRAVGPVPGWVAWRLRGAPTVDSDEAEFQRATQSDKDYIELLEGRADHWQGKCGVLAAEVGRLKELADLIGVREDKLIAEVERLTAYSAGLETKDGIRLAEVEQAEVRCARYGEILDALITATHDEGDLDGLLRITRVTKGLDRHRKERE